MPIKKRIVEIARLPTDKVRFVDTQPALKTKFEEYKNAGKVTVAPQEWSTDGAIRIVKTTTLWNNKNDFEEFQTWSNEKYLALSKEYELANGIKITRTLTEE